MSYQSIKNGYTGFQGFQYECNVNGHEIAKQKTITGDDLIFFAGMNVTRTLPFGTVDDVIDEIDYVLDFTDEGKGLFFFTSNSIQPEVALENILPAYKYIASGEYLKKDKKKFPEWPGLNKSYDYSSKDAD